MNPVLMGEKISFKKESRGTILHHAQEGILVTSLLVRILFVTTEILIPMGENVR